MEYSDDQIKGKEAVICQLARMGDLVQTLPLISRLSANSLLTLICDVRIKQWAEQLAVVKNIITLNTASWRKECAGGILPLAQMITRMQEDFCNLSDGRGRDFFFLNDHPVCNAIAAWIYNENDPAWLSPELILVRSYLRTIVSERQMNRIHLSDLWSYLAGDKSDRSKSGIILTAEGIQFAKLTLTPLKQTGIKRFWAFILGSGGKYRRLPPQYFIGYWNNIPDGDKIGLILIGGAEERSLADNFLNGLKNNTGEVLDLVGKCSPEQLMGIFSEVDLVVGVDTGPLHWAAAVGTPVLGMYFGEAGFRDTGPYGEGHYVLTPECLEYPCGVERAIDCGFLCHKVFSHHSDIVKLMIALSQGDSNHQMEVPSALKLFRSKLTPRGTTYQPVGGAVDSAEATEFSHFAHTVLSQSDNGINAKPTLKYEIGRKLAERWRNEISALSIGPTVSSQFEEEVKREALRRLQSIQTDEYALNQQKLNDPVPSCALSY